VDPAQFDRLPELIKQIIHIDRKLAEIRKAKIVRLSSELGSTLRYRRSLVAQAHQKWGNMRKSYNDLSDR
jgi:hypothetical protein